MYRLIAETANGYDLKIGTISVFFSQTANVNVNGSLVALAIHIPNFIHKLTAGEYLAGVGKKLEKEQKFLLGMLVCGVAANHGE